MFRLKVLFNGEWRWGIREYATIEEANNRIAKLSEVGIKAIARPNAELFH